MKITSLPLVFIFLWMLGCSSTPQAKTSYLLRSEASLESAEMVTKPVAYLGVLELANYLDQPGLVTETQPGQVHSARQHQWAEPLQTSLRAFLAMELSSAMKAPVLKQKHVSADELRVDVTIDLLHGTADGRAVLVAYWSLVADGERKAFRYVESQTLDGVGYAALVAAESALLVDLADAIALELKAEVTN